MECFKANKLTPLLLSGLLLTSIQAVAAPVAWVGSADYKLAPGAAGDEEKVGPFDSYDLANGVSLLSPTFVKVPGSVTVGDTFDGFFQSYVSLHQLNGISADNTPSMLVTDGGLANGIGGYELTLAATFSTIINGVDSSGNFTFSVTGGSADLYFDTTPDYSFTDDTGFTNGASIISSSIMGGEGAFLPVFNQGFSGITLSIGPFGYDPDVYDPPTINGGDGIFTLNVNNSGTGPTAGVTRVLNQVVATGDILQEADGNLKLTAVPVPASVWLFGSGLLGLVGIARRRVA